MPKLNDLTGKTFGHWTVLYRNGSTPNKAVRWRCRCNLCGNEYDVSGYSLTSGASTKCRHCVPKVTLTKPHRNERIYNIFNGMMARCYNKNNSRYSDYGGRGISVCAEWYKNPDAFFEWAFANGYRDGLTIDRINNDEGYSPHNCQWTDSLTQNKNRRNCIFVTHNGTQQNLRSACKSANVNYDTVRWYARKHKCSMQDAFDHYL